MHRDIKPANILIGLTQDGKLILKIIDFSISKIISDPATEFLYDLFTNGVYNPPFSKLGTRKITTRPYRAPEVAMMQNYDISIDIWGVGCIFAEMLMSTISMKR